MADESVVALEASGTGIIAINPHLGIIAPDSEIVTTRISSPPTLRRFGAPSATSTFSRCADKSNMASIRHSTQVPSPSPNITYANEPVAESLATGRETQPVSGLDMAALLRQNQEVMLQQSKLLRDLHSKVRDIEKRKSDVHDDRTEASKRPRNEITSQQEDYTSALDALLGDKDQHSHDHSESGYECADDSSHHESVTLDDDRSVVDVEVSEDNRSVLQSLQDFLANAEKTGPAISPPLADMANNGFRSRVSEDKVKELTMKYNKPANVDKLTVARVNSGVWNTLRKSTKDLDAKLQRYQTLLSKAFCPLLHLMDSCFKASKEGKGMSHTQVNETLSMANDTFKLCQIAFTDMNYR
ncbi:uncharacterized protein LOC110456941 [Mizuhopecten yessoensis]|uniref:uncharacterized protein LOC110456941 n=1 Tax=Mizuhopecten yessoensis TaxID=6573 RepID=UPI000B45B99B|nr:uncharacterized protein LOC110456941 [Mizuhopecten yessoensis]